MNPQGIAILHLKTEFPGCYITLVFRQAGPLIPAYFLGT